MPTVEFSPKQENENELNGYVTKCGTFAAVPYGNQYIIIHNGQQIKLSKTLTTAKSYISKELRKIKKWFMWI